MSAYHPTLYQIDIRPWLWGLGQEAGLGRPATFDDVPDSVLEEFAGKGFDWVYLLGAWQTSPAGQKVAAEEPSLRAAYLQGLADFEEADVSGSPFAIVGYAVHSDFGGPAALARLRGRLARLGMRLILDFVPNHTAPDHPWTQTHPEFYVHGSEADLAAQPANYTTVQTPRGPTVLAHGRDPNFPGWTDTLQLNYRHGGTRAAQIVELMQVAGQCDGVRCDMAMLLLPEVIHQTWADRSLPADGTPPVEASWWLEAIPTVRAAHPDFVFMAETYWDLEWTLQQQGFDYTYDKRLYDRLRALNTTGVNQHLRYASFDYQRRSARFLENHDEPRAASTFPPGEHQAAAIITYLAPGLRFFHLGQLEGCRTRVPIQLRRWPIEPADAALQAFYDRLLACLARPEARSGEWTWLECRPAWDGNATWENFVAFTWQDVTTGARLLACANYGPTQGQCFANLSPVPGLPGASFRLSDLTSPAVYDREGDDLARRGLYLDLAAWGYNVFDVKRV